MTTLFKRFLTFAWEMIGGPQRLTTFRSRVISQFSPNYDSGTADYKTLDRARRAKARGLEITGLFLKPISSKITAWALGRPPSFKAGNEAANTELAEWWRGHHAEVMGAAEESLNLADYYVVINADLTVTLIPPDAVTPIVNEDNFGEIVGWRVEMTYQHPIDSRIQTRRDEYYADRRIQTIITGGRQTNPRTFRNVIGRIPVVHVPNNKGANEMFGHCEWEDLIPMLQKMGEVLDAAIKGNVRHGRPTPVFERMGDKSAVADFWKRFGKTRVNRKPDGTTEEENYLEWNADMVTTVGGTTTFDWKSPQAFMGDVTALMGIFGDIFVTYIEIPEWALGNAIPSSQASANTQVEPLVKFIEKKRSFMQPWLLEICQIVLGYLNVVNPQVSLEAPQIKWDDLTTKDGRLTLDTIKWALEQGIITKETAIRLMPAEVENPKEELAQAEAEREKLQQQFNDGADARLAAAQAQAQKMDNAAQDDTPAADLAKVA